MAQPDRPLSPHIGIYKWQISNSLSILHRLTGIALAFGALAFVGWLVSIASGPGTYFAYNNFFTGIIGSIMLFGWTFCFFYHLSNGIRHLFWDSGRGFDPDRARQTGVAVVVAALLLTIIAWAVAISS